MNFELFMETVKSEVEKQLEGRKTEISITEVLKNNGLTLHGLNIREENQMIPTIYLEPFFKVYRSKGKMEEIVEDIFLTYEKHKHDIPIDMETFLDYNKIKDKIVYKLVNYELNKEFLKIVPYVRHLDLAIYFYVMINTEDFGDATISIYNNHLRLWNVKIEEVYEIAKANVERLLPVEIKSMSDIISDMLEEDMADLMDEDSPMYVISNSRKLFGASVLFYENNEIGKFAESLKSDLFILPSSLHECILIPVSENVNIEMLREMVRDVNRTQVDMDDRLSDSVYIYERASKEIKIAE
ncbi:DUF5688 family protein [Konateibacter massiliensis]|uniref:DUF5688 family protein n=1 Tax=Konateibacter massiliensis TaxID=2002841 RepID=UPI000C160D6A|nr:DUF5688 family protein [Konateibacter massiliensis]